MTVDKKKTKMDILIVNKKPQNEPRDCEQKIQKEPSHNEQKISKKKLVIMSQKTPKEPSGS